MKSLLKLSAAWMAGLALVGAHGAFATEAPAVLDGGYMNVATIDGSDCGDGQPDGFCFGGGWGVGDLKATVAGNTYTLQPNFQAFNASDAYWSSVDGLAGNKIMEAILKKDLPLSADPYGAEFSGTVDSFTLDADFYSAYTSQDYRVEAFILVLNPDDGYSESLNETVVIAPTDTEFSVTADLSAYPNQLAQIGFRVIGLNANPADEGDLGSAVMTVTAAGLTEEPEEEPEPEPEPEPEVEATPVPALPLWGLLGLLGLIGLIGSRSRR